MSAKPVFSDDGAFEGYRGVASDITQRRLAEKQIHDLAHSLGMRTTAEGVETERQAEMLKMERCTELQGYLFSRPKLPADLVESAILTRRAAAVPDQSETVTLPARQNGALRRVV